SLSRHSAWASRPSAAWCRNRPKPPRASSGHTPMPWASSMRCSRRPAIHVPAGAVPKDGPSAGITMATALASVSTGLPVGSDAAMTGEMTLTGLVLPIGGVKEKVLAARRADLHRVILPIGNAKDLRKLPENVRAEMEFLFAECSEDVCAAAIPELAERLAI